MDIYEFSQALWRRKWLLGVGLILLLAFVIGMAFDFSDGVSLRSAAKYEADIELAVVPVGYESLAQDLGQRPMVNEATLFASLLASPQAAQEVADKAGLRVLELEAGASGRNRFLSVTARTDSPEGAVAAGLGAFQWLEQRISEPLVVATGPVSENQESVTLDPNELFVGNVRVEADRSLAMSGDGLWIVGETRSGDSIAFRLADAADETTSVYAARVRPGEVLSMFLEGAEGQTLDVARVRVPEISEDGASTDELVIGLERGLVRGTIEEPRLDAAHLTANWRPSVLGAANVGEEDVDVLDVSILLLTDEPIPETIGGRKTPLLVVAVLSAGIIALLVLVVVVDSWAEQHRLRRQAGTFDLSLSPPDPAGRKAGDVQHHVDPESVLVE